jgi:hypothetical protein
MLQLSLCGRQVVTCGALLAARLSGRSRRWSRVADERRSEDRCGWSKGLRTLVFTISEASTVATVSTRGTLIKAAVNCHGRP